MKTYNILIIAALMTLAGCTEDTTSTFVNRSGGITATVENGMEKTRSTMIDSPTQRIDFNWEQDDIIGVFDSENKNSLFSATEIADEGSTAVFKSDGSLPQGAFIAYYPYSDDAQCSAGNVLTLSMPAVQDYVERDYKAQPDARVNIMVGQGLDQNVIFKNVFAILKIGYVASSEDAVQRIVFSDLSGQPVSGAFTVTMEDGIPMAEFPASGDGNTIALSCGSGVNVKPDDIVSFYLVVPAREYAQGFKLDFELASGSTDSRTIGTRAGKTLLRSMVYSVGDVSVITEKDYTVDFGEAGGVIMDDDLMAMVMSINDLGFKDFDDEMGNCYEIVMKQGAGLKIGQSLVINRISEALPHGLIGRVSEIVPVNGADVIRVIQYSDASKAFKSLVIGKSDAVNEEDGSVNEEAMVPLDLSRHFSHFEPAPDTDIEVNYAGDGLKIGGEVNIGGDNTRATFGGSVTTPRLSLKFRDDDESNDVTIGATASLSLAIGASISDYSLNYIAGSITPSVKFDLQAKRTAETKPLGASKRLGRFYFAPITIGPLVAEPFVDVSLFIELKGYAEITATWDYTLGANVGFSFIRYYSGDERDWGLLGRLSNRSDGVPNIFFNIPNELSASFGAEVQAGAKLKVGIDLYRILDLANDLKLGVSLKAALDLTSKSRGMLNAGLYMAPVVEGSVSARNKSFEQVALEFDSFWYRYFYPNVRAVSAHGDYKYEVGTSKFPFYVGLYGRTITDMKVNYEIYRRPKGTLFTFSADKISEHFLDYYQSSSVLPGGVQAPYDKLEFNPTFDLKIEKGYVYTIIFRCIPTDSQSPIPAYYAPAENDNKIEIWRDTEKCIQDDGSVGEKEVILINDDQAHCEKGEDGIWYTHYYR